MDRVYSVRDMPREERPRERLFAVGAEKLSSQELLALVIGRGVSGRPVMTIAQELLARFGSVGAIGEATVEELASVKGLGPAKAALIRAAFELGRRNDLASPSPGPDVKNPDAVAKAVRRSIGDKAKEHFKLLVLNTRNRVMSIEHISTGTLNASLVHPREVFREAIRRSASSVVIAHNHPSGDPSPSEEDIHLTRRLVQAGKLLGIEVLDHVIVGADGLFSFKERGLIP